MTEVLGRRRFLLWLLAGLASLPVVKAVEQAIGPVRVSGRDVEVLKALLADLSTARLLGRSYLAAYPDEQRRLRRFKTGLGALRMDRLDELRRMVAQRSREDLEKDRVVLLDGWVVTRTEGRLLALTVSA